MLIDMAVVHLTTVFGLGQNISIRTLHYSQCRSQCTSFAFHVHEPQVLLAFIFKVVIDLNSQVDSLLYKGF